MRPEKSKLLGNKPISQPKPREVPPRLTRQLMTIPGVEGVGAGDGGRLIVYVSRSGLELLIEKKLGGKKFDVQFTGVIAAQ